MASSNVCDEGVLVPPRKRLLAGFKKPNSGGGSDQSCGSTFASPLPNGTEADYACVKNRLDSLLSASSGFSLEEIVERSNNDAVAAAKVAEAARNLAEEKAAIAAKVIASAKTALDLVSDLYEETSGRHRRSKKINSKKQVMVHSSYTRHDEDENELTDEDEFRQVIHRTHGIPKRSPTTSDFKHKRSRIWPMIEKPKVLNGAFEEARKQLIQMVERRAEELS